MLTVSPEQILEQRGVRRLPPAGYNDRDPPPASEDDYGAFAYPSATAEALPKFKVERWDHITFDIDEEWLVDGIAPKQGVGLLYGASQSLKSFVANHMGLSVARAHAWAGRKTEGASVVYLAAEGAAGLRKRRQGYVTAGRAPGTGVDFALISAAPNLGTSDGDCRALIDTIKFAGIKPGMIIVDTVAKVIGGADENGAGMAQFLVNAEALAQHFACFVLAVHHTGWNDEAKDRPRGWSGLPAALDVQILSERKAGELSATLTIQKLKDEPSGLRLEVQMQRITLGFSKTGREISTLIVDEITEWFPSLGYRALLHVRRFPLLDRLISGSGRGSKFFEVSMSDSETRQAIPLDYHAYEAALEDVRRMIASARKLGLHREVAELEKRLSAAQKALAEFDAVNVRPAVCGGFAGTSKTVR